MELLGFYDQPYQVHVARPVPPRRAASLAATRHAVTPVGHSSQVATLWETTELDDSALDWWKPGVIARRKLGARNIRASTLVIAAVAAVILAVVIHDLTQRPAEQAERSVQELRADTAVLLAGIEPLRSLATALGAPPAPDLMESTEVVLSAESAARAVFSDAGSVAEDATSMRRDAVEGAGGVLDATSTLNRLVAYRLTAERILIDPILPRDPAATTVIEATEAVASWRAGIEETLRELPSDVLPDHRMALEEWRESLEGWQVAYLDAVREEDVATMVQELDAQMDAISGLHARLLADLQARGDDLDRVLAEAEDSLRRLIAG